MKTINIYDVKLNDDRVALLVKEDTRQYEYPNIIEPEGVANLMKNVFELHNKAEEHFYMITLNANGDIIGVFLISKGALKETNIHPREVFKRAILCNAHSVIFAHNHVSGNLTPSNDDITTTKMLIEAGELLRIPVFDHLIIAHTGYNSLRVDGYI